MSCNKTHIKETPGNLATHSSAFHANHRMSSSGSQVVAASGTGANVSKHK